MNGLGLCGVLVRVSVWLLLFNYHLRLSEGCPLVCICKWKGGKQTVECKNQALKELPDKIDSETQVLDISGNQLGILPQDLFQRAGLLNLQKIYIRHSRLTQIDSRAFNQLINLVEMDLSDNNLTVVPFGAFKSTPFLRELNLAGNPIVQIKNTAFENIPQLVKLDLSRCKLIVIEDLAFTHFQMLESLKINLNQLTILSNTTVKSLAQLHNVELEGNPWDCDCRLRDLKLWIEAQNIPHPVSPTCHTPPRLAGRQFSELPVTEFACQPKILDSSRQTKVHEGENATLECIVESIPVTNIRWYLYGRPIANNTQISPNRKFLIYEDETRSLLVLMNALRKDEGEFFCVVENPAGFIEANFTLEILPPPPFPTLDTTHILIIALSIVAILIIVFVAGLCICWRRRRRTRATKPPEILATSTPVKPPRLNYEINPGSLVANGFKNKGDSTENPDLILETNNSGTYQETTIEDQSSNSELNWEQQSYRNMGYSTEYPPDYGLPIIHENSVYSESSYYNNMNNGTGNSKSSANTNNVNSISTSNGNVVMSGVWNKNKVGARITAPNSRDSPDEGYQEGYCGTDV